MGTSIDSVTCRKCSNPEAVCYAYTGDPPDFYLCDLCGLSANVDLETGDIEETGGYGCVLVTRLIERRWKNTARDYGVRVQRHPALPQPRWRGFDRLRKRQRSAPWLARWRGFANRRKLSAVKVTLQIGGKWREIDLSSQPGRGRAKRRKPEPRKRLNWKRFKSLRPEPRPIIPPTPADEFSDLDIPF